MDKLTNFGSLQRKKLYEEVAEALKKTIFRGEYQVGDRLPSENKLAEAFSVSRPVIREAIRYLEVRGLVTVRQGATGGAFISGIDSKILKENIIDLLVLGNISIGQLTEMRAHIDPEIARLAAVRADEKDIMELDKSVRISQDKYSTIDFSEQVENNARFHRLLGRASKNFFYTIIEDTIMDFIVEFIFNIQPEHQVLHDPNDHEEIFQAIKDHDALKASSLATKHVENIGVQLMAQEALFLRITRDREIAGV